MPRIRLKIRDGALETLSVQDNGELLELETVDRPINGNLVIGALSVRHVAGVSRVDTSLLDDGIYEPSLVTGKLILRLPCIEIKDGAFRARRTLEQTAERLEARTRELSLELEEIKERLKMLSNRFKTTIM